MKTVLWLCNRPIEAAADRRDGTWFTAMARALTESGKINLAIVSQGKVKKPAQHNFGEITQLVVPYEHLNLNGLPPHRTIESIQRAFNEIKPDLIHVWGTENYWGLLTARGFLAGPAILEMQGIKYVCAQSFYGGLSLAERTRCIGPLEILKPGRCLFLGKRRFMLWGKFEKEMILQHKYISTQSDWVRAHVLAVNPKCILFKTGIMLRKEFFVAEPWGPKTLNESSPQSVFICISDAPAYKGIHVLLRALAILKRKHLRVILNVAGDFARKGIRRSGYSIWVQREARKLGISDSIRWLGPLDAQEIVNQLCHASAVVIPSFVETYCLSMAEAMLVGTPVVASFAGAIPELARDGESALFFPPGDESACAWQLERILRDHTLARRLSHNSRQIAFSRNQSSEVLEHQTSIYAEILGYRA